MFIIEWLAESNLTFYHKIIVGLSKFYRQDKIVQNK